MVEVFCLFGYIQWMKRIYLDYASLTPIDSRVIREIKKYSSPMYANPSSLHGEGVTALRALDDGRRRTATFIGAHHDEIVYVSGGTEANGLALEGAARAAVHAGITKPHMVISSIEHSSIMETASMMEKHGCEVTRLAVDYAGVVSIEELKKAIKPNTFLVSIMAVNNEIGSIQPLREIAGVIREARKRIRGEGVTSSFSFPLFHTDAAQAALYLDLNVEKLGVDLLTLDGGKVYGPRGIGCLYVRRGTPIEPIIHGGGQENGLRSGTENLPGIMGFARALDIAGAERDGESERIRGLREYFFTELKKVCPEAQVVPDLDMSNSAQVTKKVVTSLPFSNSSLRAGAPHILNVSIPEIDNEFFVLQLDAKGVAVSTKSSCLRDLDESYVLRAIGADSGTSVRFSFGRWTGRSDLRKTLAVIARILRS